MLSLFLAVSDVHYKSLFKCCPFFSSERCALFEVCV
uniref:Uncharacterized protein n=1 Tax=Anguilla anguilla TaxID=7936 RepID=A0A0E9SS59_ANGAN